MNIICNGIITSLQQAILIFNVSEVQKKTVLKDFEIQTFQGWIIHIIQVRVLFAFTANIAFESRVGNDRLMSLPSILQACWQIDVLH